MEEKKINGTGRGLWKIRLFGYAGQCFVVAPSLSAALHTLHRELKTESDVEQAEFVYGGIYIADECLRPPSAASGPYR